MHPATLLATLISAASAAKMGFNYGSTFTTGAAKMQSDFEAEFAMAANLKDASGFTSARLYTMVQAGTANDPISAIPAAIKTKTSLLLGLWASAGDAAFANEILAMKAAIKTYGDDFANLVDGTSIGSEDMYRESPDGIAAKSGAGAGPDVLVKYINEVKQAISGTALKDAKLGHVDTWTAWDNSSSKPLVEALDWLGMDAYPYFQKTLPNAIGQSKSLFQAALSRTQEVAGGKAVWVTETGHPVSGVTSGDSVASIANAENYWKTVGCPMFGKTNVWWYTLQDAAPDTPNPSFGLVANGSTTPLFDLSCDGTGAESASSSPASNAFSASVTATANAGISAGLETATSGGACAPTTTTTCSAMTDSATTTGSGSSATGVAESPRPSPSKGGTSSLRYGSFGAAFVAIMAAIL